MIVVDPVVTETAKMADIHLRVKPGTDAWLFAAMVAMLVQNERYAHTWVADNTAMTSSRSSAPSLSPNTATMQA